MINVKNSIAIIALIELHIVLLYCCFIPVKKPQLIRPIAISVQINSLAAKHDQLHVEGPHKRPNVKHFDFAAHLDQLSTRRDLEHKTSKQLHHQVDHLIRSGRVLARVSAHTKNHINDRNVLSLAQDFFDQCSRRDDLLTSIRAMCLSELQKVMLHQGVDFNILDSNLPMAIRQLALSI